MKERITLPFAWIDAEKNTLADSLAHRDWNPTTQHLVSNQPSKQGPSFFSKLFIASSLRAPTSPAWESPRGGGGVCGCKSERSLSSFSSSAPIGARADDESQLKTSPRLMRPLGVYSWCREQHTF
jgi:hypothetical protein